MRKLEQHRNALLGAVASVGALALVTALALWQVPATAQQTMVEIPQFEVDPLWPKPIPNEWLLGMSIGVSVDDQDNIWITHRASATLHNNEKGAELKPPVANCCSGAPHVLAFNQDGDLVRSWGGPGAGLRVAGPDARHLCRPQGLCLARRQRRQGCPHPQVHQGWQVRAAVRAPGQELRQQRPGELRPRRPRLASIPKRNEAFVADGYRNRRVAVVDAETGKIKRFWGAYGNKPDDAEQGPYVPGAAVAAVPQPRALRRARQRRAALRLRPPARPRCRSSGRRQVREGGTSSHTKTSASGSTWEIAFSRDPKQRFIYMTDGMNNRIRIISARHA